MDRRVIQRKAEVRPKDRREDAERRDVEGSGYVGEPRGNTSGMPGLVGIDGERALRHANAMPAHTVGIERAVPCRTYSLRETHCGHDFYAESGWSTSSFGSLGAAGTCSMASRAVLRRRALVTAGA